MPDAAEHMDGRLLGARINKTAPAFGVREAVFSGTIAIRRPAGNDAVQSVRLPESTPT